jgi:preprotein translocase subunit SecA
MSSLPSSLPPLVLYPERAEKSGDWIDSIESAVYVVPRKIQRWLNRRGTNRFGEAVNALEEGLMAATREELQAETDELRAALRCAGFEEALVARCFALVRELSRRELGLRHHDVQILGGVALLHGAVIEMMTGEGKTLTATLAIATAALSGQPVHVVTVNDYLAERDAGTMSPLFRQLGLTTGAITHELQPQQRKAAYACDITYASNKEIAFDYLRDRIALGNQPSNLRLKLDQLEHGDTGRQAVMRGLHFAIVDEADSVLIDEARTPLIISQETNAADERRWAEAALELAERLDEGVDYRVIKDERRIELLDAGRSALITLGKELGGIWQSRIRCEQSISQALTALYLFQRGDHYLVQDGKVQIVDEYTGRIMADRSWSDGLHQLVEAKESCEITGRKLPIARMTYQRFFRRYRQLAGMTGTAREVVAELRSVYGLQFVEIPTNLPLRRSHFATRICATEEDKLRMVLESAIRLHREGRPVLIGVRSVMASEAVSAALTRAGLEHDLLNAANDKKEAEIIAAAGQSGRVTVATNMAGRGVDICLGTGVAERGGLHVILSERHDAGRIDRQLEGRCARAGDPGTTERILSLEDALLQLAIPAAVALLSYLPKRSALLLGLGLFERAQRRAERSHFRARTALLKQDSRLGGLLAFSGNLE